MAAKLKIDFVSDVVCPWCVIGYKSLEQAIERVGDEIEVEFDFLPFELNPDMAEAGEAIPDYMRRKYGSTPTQIANSHATITARGLAVGFSFDLEKRNRIYNTLDAHRVLHWARECGRQRALKLALFDAYFVHGRDVSDHSVLIEIARSVGLSRKDATFVLESTGYASNVKALEYRYAARGLTEVPTIIFNGRHMISGGQSIDFFERTIRNLIKHA